MAKLTASEQIDREYLRSALQKRQAGEKLLAPERDALRRYEKEQERELRDKYYRSVPKGDYCALSGRPSKVLDEQAHRYGLKINGRKIDLFSAIRSYHDFLAKHGPKLLKEDDPMAIAVSSPALEKYRTERAALAKMDRMERERILIKREDAHESLTRIASMLRSAGDLLEKEYGSDARAILNEAIDDVTSEVEKSFADCEEDLD